MTFLGPESVNLADRGIDEKQAADLRRRLGAFAEDWDRPEMDVYDALCPVMPAVDEALRHTLGL